MPNSFCENCSTKFFYDAEIGLNIARYEGEVTASGDFPCCPKCESRCAFEKTTYTIFDIKFSRRMVLKNDE